MAGVLIWIELNAAGWNTRKPVWWRLWDTRSASVTTVDAALSELLSRHRAGKLAADQAKALTEQALALQADESATWHTGWGDIIEYAWRNGRLNDEQRAAYARHALSLRFVPRATVRQGDQVAAEVIVSPRTGTSGLLAFDLEIDSLTLAGQSLMASAFHADGVLGLWPNAPPTAMAFAPEPGPPQLPRDAGFAMPKDANVQAAPGQHKVVVGWSARTHRASGGPVAGWMGWSRDLGPRTFTRRKSNTAPIVEWAGSTELPVQVVAASTSTVELVLDERLAEAVRKAIKVEIHDEPAGPSMRASRQVHLHVQDQPIDMAFDVTVEGPGGTWSSVLVSETGMWSQSNLDQGPSDATYTVTLKPNADLARRTTGITRIWGGKVVFKDVPVSP